MAYPEEELLWISPLEVQMVSESVPAHAARFWQLWWHAVLLAQVSFCASLLFNGYCLDEMVEKTQFIQVSLSSDIKEIQRLLY